MRKSTAIKLLGGSTTSAAKEIGISYQAVVKWPEQLPARIADRVLAVLARKHLPAHVKRQLEEEGDTALAPASNGA